MSGAAGWVLDFLNSDLGSGLELAKLFLGLQGWKYELIRIDMPPGLVVGLCRGLAFSTRCASL